MTSDLPRRMTQPCLHCLWPKRGRHLERTWWSPLSTIAETSRRLKVADRAFQHNVMLEAIQNHTPDVLIIDEIGTPIAYDKLMVPYRATDCLHSKVACACKCCSRLWWRMHVRMMDVLTDAGIPSAHGASECSSHFVR